MKKIIISIVSLVLLCMTLSSCKSQKDCPAYGYADETATEQKA